jgi:hypothetical protein
MKTSRIPGDLEVPQAHAASTEYRTGRTLSILQYIVGRTLKKNLNKERQSSCWRGTMVRHASKAQGHRRRSGPSTLPTKGMEPYMGSTMAFRWRLFFSYFSGSFNRLKTLFLRTGSCVPYRSSWILVSC